MIQHSVGKSDDSEKYQDKRVELFYQNVEKDDLKVNDDILYESSDVDIAASSMDTRNSNHVYVHRWLRQFGIYCTANH